VPRPWRSRCRASITADILNKHYSSVSTDGAYVEPDVKPDDFLPHTPITEYTIFNLLDKLKPTATGPDGLPSWFLRLSAPVFAAPLADLINKSIIHSEVPTQWKSSVIKPIPKVTHPSSPADYRPISITSVLSRLTERIITSKYIYPALSSSPPELDFTNQFAFRPTGSTTAALISLFHIITGLLETQPLVRVIALDRVDRSQLIRLVLYGSLN
jgi:hypothetical protein